jgi:hypothetical protein
MVQCLPLNGPEHRVVSTIALLRALCAVQQRWSAIIMQHAMSITVIRVVSHCTSSA